MRYAFFQELADRETDRIATAHTLSDQVETVLLHLTRGAGLRGLCGIPPVRGKIVRPFLRITREQVEAYCRFYHLPYVTDRTNADRGLCPQPGPAGRGARAESSQPSVGTGDCGR